MGNKFFIYIVLVSFIIACHKKQPAEGNTDRYQTYIRYTDSLFSRGLDTIKLLQDDLLSISKLTGYFRIVDASGTYYHAGLLNKGIKEKTWKAYHVWSPVNSTLDVSDQYRNGKLNGKCFSYTQNGELIISHNYKDNQQFGQQLEYLDGKKTLAYSIDEQGNYVGDYLALNSKGDTLYYTNFGNESSGYLKRYTRWGVVEMEGAIIKGKMKGYKVYEYDYGSKKYIKVQYFRCTDSGDVFQKVVYFKK
jgi:antitoxin component YwqK of YwqJK toxin-antitoxin module